MWAATAHSPCQWLSLFVFENTTVILQQSPPTNGQERFIKIVDPSVYRGDFFFEGCLVIRTRYCFFVFLFFRKKLNSRNVYNWQLFETKQTPSKSFSPAAGRTERNILKFFSPAVSKTRKKSHKCAQLAAIWKFWNMLTWKQICNFKVCVFFEGDILQNFFRLRQAKIIGGLGEPSYAPRPVKKK